MVRTERPVVAIIHISLDDFVEVQGAAFGQMGGFPEGFLAGNLHVAQVGKVNAVLNAAEIFNHIHEVVVGVAAQ
ncbi:hypothetical protein D3C73_1500780 [compost metagenome]